jgi:hypothetical protein
MSAGQAKEDMLKRNAENRLASVQANRESGCAMHCRALEGKARMVLSESMCEHDCDTVKWLN